MSSDVDVREAFLVKVRARLLNDAPYVVDYGGGFGGSTVVTGPTLRIGYILMSADDKRPERMAEDLNSAWAYGYEQGHADGLVRGKGSIPNEADTARAERNGIISRLRARWPHIQIAKDGQRVDPGAPTCLRCSIEDEIGPPWHDGLGPKRTAGETA